VPRVVVDVMLKPEILDPQGQAVVGALPRLGISGITAVRQGKRFELEIDGALTDDRIGEVRKLAETLLANPVIEDFDVRIDGGEGGYDGALLGSSTPEAAPSARAAAELPEIASELERAIAAERAASSGVTPSEPPSTEAPPSGVPTSEPPTSGVAPSGATPPPPAVTVPPAESGEPAGSAGDDPTESQPALGQDLPESSVTPTSSERGGA
jgi:phosphoribosylformylglycinamidine synthase subunit PurS